MGRDAPRWVRQVNFSRSGCYWGLEATRRPAVGISQLSQQRLDAAAGRFAVPWEAVIAGEAKRSRVAIIRWISAGAAGIGLSYGGQMQMALNLISPALVSAGIATNMSSDFASGNLGQGLLDGLNLYLPAVAQAFANYQSNQSALQAPLQTVTAALTTAAANGTANTVLDTGSIVNVSSQSAMPPPNADGLTVTSGGATNTIYVAPSSSGSSGQADGSASIVVDAVPQATAGGNVGSTATQPNPLEILATVSSASVYSQAQPGNVPSGSPLIFSPNAFNSSWDTGIDPTFSDLASAANAAGASGTPNTISASPGQQASGFMQFLHAATASIRLPDYISFTGNLGSYLGGYFGGTLALTVYRYDDVFTSPGPAAGISANPVSESFTLNWMNQTTTPSQAQLSAIVTAHGLNVTGGYFGGVSESYTPGTGWATGVGVVTPQAGVSYTYSRKLGNLGSGW